MKDYVCLGPAPVEESCAQIGDHSYEVLATEQCKRYIKRIRDFVGEEVETAKLKIKSNYHDFGVYYEVICEYSVEDDISREYAFKCENHGPLTWNED